MLNKQGFTGRAVFLVPSTAALIVLVDQIVVNGPSGWRQRWPWAFLPVIVGLAAAGRQR
jgi:hypothetical protein